MLRFVVRRRWSSSPTAAVATGTATVTNNSFLRGLGATAAANTLGTATATATAAADDDDDVGGVARRRREGRRRHPLRPLGLIRSSSTAMRSTHFRFHDPPSSGSGGRRYSTSRLSSSKSSTSTLPLKGFLNSRRKEQQGPFEYGDDVAAVGAATEEKENGDDAATSDVHVDWVEEGIYWSEDVGGAEIWSPSSSSKVDEDDDIQSARENFRSELNRLLAATDDACAHAPIPASSSPAPSPEEILALMGEWKEFSTAFRDYGRSLHSGFRKRHPDYPPSIFAANVCDAAAGSVERLLLRLVDRDPDSDSLPLPPPLRASTDEEIRAHRLALDVYSRACPHARSGDRAADALGRWTDAHGGDMDRAPTVEAYDRVLEGYVESCPAFFSGGGDDASSRLGGRRCAQKQFADDRGTPADAALGALRLLHDVRQTGGMDQSLKPGAETHSHAVRAVRWTLLDWKARRRFETKVAEVGGGISSSAEGAEDDRRAGRRRALLEEREAELVRGALWAVERMEATALSTTDRPDLETVRFVVRAYADALAVASRIPPSRSMPNVRAGDDNEAMAATAESLLESLERFIDGARCATEGSARGGAADGADGERLEDIRRCVEGAYADAISSRVRSSVGTRGQRGIGTDGIRCGNDRDDDGTEERSGLECAFSNATKAEEIFRRMERRAGEAMGRNDDVDAGRRRKTASIFYPPPSANHYRELMRSWSECLRSQYFTLEANRYISMVLTSSGEEGGLFINPATKCEDLLYEMEDRVLSQRYYSSMSSLGEKEPVVSEGSIYLCAVWAWRQMSYWPVYFESSASLTSASVPSQSPSGLHHRSHADATESVERILRHALVRYEEGNVRFSKPDDAAKMFNLALNMYANNDNHQDGNAKNAVERSLSLLDEMEDLYRSSGGGNDGGGDGNASPAVGKPNAHTFELLLLTISQSGLRDAGRIAASLLPRMEHDFGVRPRGNHYLAVIAAHSRTGGVGRRKWGARRDRHEDDGGADAEGAESVLRTVTERYRVERGGVKPDTAMHAACITAHARSGSEDSARRAEALLLELEGLYESTGDEAFEPDGYIYCAVIDALAKSMPKNSKKSKLKSQDGSSTVDRALTLLKRMEDKYAAGDSTMKPNGHVCAAVLNCLARSDSVDRQSVEVAESLVRWMDDASVEHDDDSTRPDTVVYTTLLQVLSRCHDVRDAVERAERYVKVMESRAADGDIRAKPNAMTYTSLINCWWKSGRPDAGRGAEEVLDRMLRQYDCAGDHACRPDAHAYGSVINAWGRSRDEDKAVRAWGVYEQMKRRYDGGDLGAKPNAVIFTSIINACGHTRGSPSAKRLALKVMLECISAMRSDRHLNPSPVAFRTMLDSVKHLIDDANERRPVSAAVFERCCKAGKLDSTVVRALKSAQPDLYAKLPFVDVESGKVRSGDIPTGWNRNVGRRIERR